MTSSPIAFIGLGAMGLPIATNLARDGHALSVYNRSADKAAPLLQAGCRLASTPAAAVQAAGIVFTMLANDAALEQVTLGSDGFADRLGEGGLHISLSTVSADLSRRLAAEHARRGSQFVAAPVFGRPDAAAARKLWIIQSGDASARARALPLLQSLGQGVHDWGDDPGAANVVKLSGNFLILSVVEALAESMAMAERHGIDRQQLADFFGQTLFPCPIYQNYGRGLAQRRYDPALFKLELGMKDMKLVRDCAEQAQVPMPLADLLRARLLASLAKQRGALDWTAIELDCAEAAGLAP